MENQINIGDLIEYKHHEHHWERGIVTEISEYGDVGVFLFDCRKDQLIFSKDYDKLKHRRLSIGKIGYSSDEEYTKLRLVSKANYSY